MEQKVKLYKYDNGELVSFPSKESQIEIGVFTYTAKRMGDAPTITATINYKECLDNLWTGKECVIFNDEFFYVKNIPTSSYSNTDSRYKHECTFVNERSKLNGVLFTDVVDDKASDGKPVSNSSKFSFNGNITEFVARLNASLRYAKLQTIENSLVYGYHVVIDECTKAIENFNDTFNVSFEDKTISEAIQEIYNSYNIPYYFEGKTVHVGLIDEEHDLLRDIDGGFKYGVNNELISISKSNKNNKIINRITALGSSENIPYYYPNETEKGSVAVTEYGKDTIPSYVELFNPFLFAKRIGKDDKIHYLKGDVSWSTGVTIYEGDDSLDFKNVSFDESVKVKCEREDGSLQDASNIKICFSIHVKNEKDYFRIKPSIAIDNTQFSSDYEYSFNKDLVVDAYLSNERGRIELEASDEGFNPVEIPVGSYQLWITYKVSHRAPKWDGKGSSPILDKNVKVKLEVFNSYEKFWFLNDSTTRYNLEDFGLRLTGGVSPYNGMAFSQKVTIPYYPISQNLILPIYRSTQGEERFYNAYNATYKDENGNYYDFKNEYAEDSISEHIVKFDDIKPTIKGVEYNGRRIDKFVEFAYDKSDNDLKQVVEDKEEYQHPYFFAKLPPLGFNLFDHALETGEMTISMTSGHCAGCSFTIMVNDANKNTVQVDEDGNLKYDEGGYVLVGSVNGQGNQSPIDSQNDTTNNSVWIALKKDIDSFGTILPSSNIKPSSNDTFVITNILLPQEYIEAAEERLKNEAIKYMAENNSSKFSFSIKFSRIFLAENPTIFDKISENSRIAVNYNGSIYPLHVSSYSYKMSEGALLPEIDVSLTDSVVIATNAIESAVSEAKADVLTYVDRYATLEEATTIFIRKDKEDYSPSPMVYGRSLTVNESHKVGENLDVAKNATIGEKTTTKAIQVGEQASVGNYVEGVSGIVMKIDSDGSSYMELDRLKVRMKAYFDELEVQKVNTVGGKMIMSPAGSFTCGAVLTSEELLANGEEVDTTNGSFYRCFFNAVQDDEQIENKFIVGDFAFSQSFNLTGRSSNKMYWREVVGVSSTYVDLSYDKCALDSDIPSSGDIICQLGSKVKDRQNAIVMTTVDEYAPAITLHYGIDKFSLSGTEIIQYGVRDGKAFFNSYGDMFLGEKPVEGVSNAYMKYTTEGGLEIKGKLTVGSTYKDKELGELFDAQQESLEDFKVSVTKEFENIRNEMDGAIDTWFGEETPTLENKPASDWLTNTDKDSHLGDLYYSNDGKAYRFQYTETEGYYWATIEDSEVVKALELAQKALDTADGKRTIFIEQPIPPYQVGDLWAAGENQPLKRCIKSREDKAESFYESDWDLADNSQAYADAIKDELQKSIKSAEDSLNKAIEDAEKAAKDYTDEGKTAVQKRIDELDDAKANVENVYAKAEIDNKITTAEALAVAAAKKQADAAIELSEKTTKAYADGIVTEEEKERIKQAEENLEAAKKYAEDKANEAFNNAKAEVEKFDYLKAALKESTDSDGGLIQTSLIKLGYTNADGEHQVMSGTNGIADSSLIGGGIATWWGGEMHDLLDYYTWDNEWIAKKDVTIPSNIPSGLIRFDGTGYFAKGNIWWDETGNLHADPLSFFVGEDSVGSLLASFQVVNDKDGKIDYLIPKAPFSSLTVGELRIKDEDNSFVTIKFKNGVLHVDKSLASDGTLSSLGVGSSEGGGVSYNRLDSWDSYTDDKAGYVLSAALGWDLKTRLDNLDLGDFDLSAYLTKSEASGTYATIASLNSYATKTWVNDNYINKDTSSIYIDKVENNVFKGGLLLGSTRVAGITPYESESWILDNATGNATFNGKLEVGAWSSYPIIALLSGNTPYSILSKSSSAFTGAANIYEGNADTGLLRIGLSTDNIVTYDSSGKQTAKISTSTGEASFKSLKVNDAAIGSLTVVNSFTIGDGDAKIWWDATNKVLRTNVSFASDKTVSSLGVGTESGGGGTGGYASLDNVASDVLPSTNNTFTIGNSSRLWKAVYANNLYLGTTNVGESISSLQSALSTANGNIGTLNTRVTNIEGGYAKKATTLAGYGITDALSLNGGTMNIGASITWSAQNGKASYIGQYASDGSLLISIDGTETSSGLVLGGTSGNLLWKGAKVIDTINISDYALPLIGGEISGNLTVGEWLAVRDVIYAHKGLEVSKTIKGIADNDDEVWSIDNTGAATVKNIKVGSNERIHGGGNNFYIGNASNAGWVGMQNICSQDALGDSKWSIRTDGRASFGSTLKVTGATTLLSTLGVSGVATFNSNIKAKGYIYFGANDEAWIYWDAGKRVLRTNVSFASDKTLSSLGVGTDEGGGGSADWGAVPTSIIPVVNGKFNLGTAANRWNVLYANGMNISDSIVFTTNSSVIAYGTFKAASIDGDLIPFIDGEYNIGSPTMGWNEIYANEVNASVITENGLKVATKNWVESNYVLNSALATVATSGSYNDLTNKPTTLSGYGITDALKVTIPDSEYPREVELDYVDIYCKNALSVDTIYFRNGFGLTTAPDEPSNLYYDGGVILSDWNFDNYALPLAGGELSGNLTVGEWLAVRDVIYAHKGLEVSKTIKGIAENDDETWSIGGDTGEASFAKITSSGSINSKSTTSGQTVQIGHNSTASILQCIANTTGQTGKTFLIQNSTGSSSLIRNTGVGDGSGIGGDMTFVCSDTFNNEITGLLLCNKTVAPTKIAVLGTCLGASMRTALDEYGSGVDIAGGVLAISSKETSYQNIHSAILDWDKSTSTLYFKKFYKNDSGTWTTGAMSVDVNGSLTVSGDILPSTTDTQSLGSTSSYWKNLYVGIITGHYKSGDVVKFSGSINANEGNISCKSLTVNGVAITGSGGGSFNGGTVSGETIFGSVGSNYMDTYQVYIGGVLGVEGFIDAWGGVAGNGWEIMNTGDAYFQSVGQASDATLKTILKDVRLSLGTMANAPLVQFDWKNKVNKKHHVGTIAQYWEDALPEVVSTTTNGTLALGYGELGVAMGISLAKEMTETLTRMDNTDSEVDKLKKRISELEKEIEDLKAV